MATIDVLRNHNFLSIVCITPARTAAVAIQATESKRQGEVLLEADETGDKLVIDRIACNKDNYERVKYVELEYSYCPTQDT